VPSLFHISRLAVGTLIMGRPIEDKDVKLACDKAYSKDNELGSDHVEVLEEENKVDLSLLPNKERKKILN
jgi:hypothetical protein